MILNVKFRLRSERATVIRMLSPRCYLVQTTDGVVYKRNRVHLRPVTFPSSPDGLSNIVVAQDPRRFKRPNRFVP